MEVEEAELGMAMEVWVSTQEELAMAVASTPTPTLEHTYSAIVSIPTPIPILTTVSFPIPTPAPIYSTSTTTSAIPLTLLPISDEISDTFPYALGQGPHPKLLPQQSALEQSSTSVESPISSPMASPPAPFNAHLDPVDMQLMKEKLEECKGQQENALYRGGKSIPYIRVVPVLEQSLHEGAGVALTEPLP